MLLGWEHLRYLELVFCYSRFTFSKELKNDISTTVFDSCCSCWQCAFWCALVLEKAWRDLMQSFLFSQRRLVGIFLVSVFLVSAFQIWSDWVLATPLNAAISLSSPSKVSRQIYIPISSQTYQLELLFDRNNLPFEDLKRVVGAMGVCQIGESCSTGVVAPMRWTLERDGKLILQDQVNSTNSHGWSSKQISRRLGNINVPSGAYLFRAEVLKSIPEFTGITAHISMKTSRLSSSNGWHVAVILIGELLKYLLILPLVLYAGGMLFLNAYKIRHQK